MTTDGTPNANANQADPSKPNSPENGADGKKNFADGIPQERWDRVIKERNDFKQRLSELETAGKTGTLTDADRTELETLRQDKAQREQQEEANKASQEIRDAKNTILKTYPLAAKFIEATGVEPNAVDAKEWEEKVAKLNSDISSGKIKIGDSSQDGKPPVIVDRNSDDGKPNVAPTITDVAKMPTGEYAKIPKEQRDDMLRSLDKK